MLSLSHVQRIFLARAPTDMRKQATGLSALVADTLGKDPLSGDAFVFLNVTGLRTSPAPRSEGV